MIFVLLSLVPLQDLQNWLKELKDSLATHWQEWLVVVVICVIGLLVRVLWLDSFPASMPEDEAYFALEGAQINTLYQWHGTPFTDATVFKFPRLFCVFQAMSIKLFGQTVAAARFPSVILGVWAIAGTYLAARLMFDRRSALLAGLFMALLPIHIQFSRLGINQSMDIAFAIWLMVFLVAAIKTNNKMSYGLAGIMLGLSQYGYLAASMMPILTLLYILHAYRVSRCKPSYFLTHCLIIFLVAGAVFAPQLYSRLEDGNLFHPRIGQIAIWAAPESRLNIASNLDRLPEFWWGQITKSFLSYINVLDAGLFYGKFAPFLGWVAPVFLLIGIWHTLRFWRKPNHLLLNAWWIGATIFGSVLIVNPPEYQRLAIAIPALVILVAVGIATAADSMTRRLPFPTTAPIAAMLSLLIISLLSVGMLKEYLVEYRAANPFFYPDDRNRILDDVSDKVLPVLQGYRVWFLTERSVNLYLPESPVVRYKNPYIDSVEYRGTLEELVATLTAYQGKQAVIIVPNYPNYSAIIKQLVQVPSIQLQRPFWELGKDRPSVIVFASTQADS